MPVKLTKEELKDVAEYKSGMMFERMRKILVELQEAGDDGLTKDEYAIKTGQCTRETYSSDGVYDRFHRNCRMMIDVGYLRNRIRDGQPFRYYIPNSGNEFDIEDVLKGMRRNARLLSRKFKGKDAYYESPYARTGEYLKDL